MQLLPPLGDRKLKGLHPLKFVTPALGLIHIAYALFLFFYPSLLLSSTCMYNGECLFRARAMAQYAALQGVLWLSINFMDKRFRYFMGWVLAINAFAFLANTNIGWALGFIPRQYDVLFAPAGTAYLRSFEAIIGFWIAIRAFEPDEGFKAAEAARKKQLAKKAT